MGVINGNRSLFKSKYNRIYPAGYKPFHVTKILVGRKKKEERDSSGRLSYHRLRKDYPH
jgi:hypothetical protein